MTDINLVTNSLPIEQQTVYMNDELSNTFKFQRMWLEH